MYLNVVRPSLQEKVKRVVYDMSKDSAHHHNEVRKQVCLQTSFATDEQVFLGAMPRVRLHLQAKVTERIASMKALQSQLSEAALLNRERELQPLLAQLEARRDLSQVWLHVDMDAFFAACEERDNPELKKIPVASTMLLISGQHLFPSLIHV